jgi:predicted O-methyltransferase YrrM
MGFNRLIRFVCKYAVAAASCAFTLTLGLFFPRTRIHISDICRIFGYNPTLIVPSIPEVALKEIFDDNIPVRLREPVDTNGNITLLELVAITKFIVKHKPLGLFEIGTFDGRTTLNLAANSPAEAKVYTLDLPKEQMNSTALGLSGKHSPDDKLFIDKNGSGSRYRGTDCQSKITQLYGDSATFDFSPFFNAMDFIFIDGSHSHDYVMNDSAISLKLLRNRRGIIVWHDYDTVWEGVTEALNKLHGTMPDFAKMRHICGTALVYLLLS